MTTENEALRFLRDSGARLADLIRMNGPPCVIVQECGLLVRGMARHVGPDTIRVWLDEFMEMMIADMEVGSPGVECVHCRGLGRTTTHCGRNPQCVHCRGLGRV